MAKWKCPLCEVAFGMASRLADHLIHGHPEEMRYRNGQVRCWCGKEFYCYALYQHLIDHQPVADHFLRSALGTDITLEEQP